jgi:hypothetical protein
MFLYLCRKGGSSEYQVGDSTSQPVLSVHRSCELVGPAEFPICQYIEDLSIAVDHTLLTLFLCAFTAEHVVQQSPFEHLH